MASIDSGRPAPHAPPAPVGRAGAPGRAGTLVDGRVDRPARRRTAVIRRALRRALRREARRLATREHVAAIILLAIAGGIGLAGMWARGELGGSDARAYWAAARIWLNGGDPYHPTGPFMPYVYSPWILPIFLPWALLPWDVAWFVYRGGTILLLLWTVAWAYRIHPLRTGVVGLVLAFPIFANLDTGNINLPLVLLLWSAQFTGPRTAGALWALATAMKLVPLVFLPVLRPPARLWGVIFLAVAVCLTLATLPMTLVQIQVLTALPRPPRLDYLVFLWALLPPFWRQSDAWWFARRGSWGRWTGAARAALGRGAESLRRDPAGATGAAGSRLRSGVLGFFGLAR